MTWQNREDGYEGNRHRDPGPAQGPRPSGTSSLPSLAIILFATILLGGAGGWFLSSQGDTSVPAVSAVAPEEIPAAIETLNQAAQQSMKSDSRGCRYPMGFITVATPGNPAGGTVSFRTSKYQSPPFRVTDKPQRIAMPNPLPGTGGVDLLSADGDAKGLLVSLYPTARMEPINGTSTVKVIWRPGPPCKS